MENCVFIHTNHKQIVGAIVAEYALRRNSRNNDRFDVRIIQLKDHPFFQEHEGRLYLRDGMKRPWLNEDLQSFTPLRFMPPELMGYSGRAVVIDPDIFAVGDVWELLSRDMQGKSIMCRPRDKFRRFPPLRALMKARRKLLGEYALLGHYRRHPDPNQENLFFGLLKECLDKGLTNEEMIRDEMRQNHVRHDALEVVERTPQLTGAWR